MNSKIRIFCYFLSEDGEDKMSIAIFDPFYDLVCISFIQKYTHKEDFGIWCTVGLCIAFFEASLCITIVSS